MADFEKLIRKHANDEGSIPADSVQGLAQAVADFVGKNFVTLERYNSKKTLADELQEKLEAAEKGKQDYDKLKNDFDKYKADQEEKSTLAEKEKAFRGILKGLNIPEKWHDRIVESANLSSFDFADGKFKDESSIKQGVKDKWADVIPTVKETGVDTPNPPKGSTGDVVTRADVYKKDDKGRFVMDATERQKALASIIAAEQQKG